jgi:UDP-N-acetyl-D-glucosamine dehydrogenase
MSTVAIVGAGYVGVPLARVFADAGETVVLVDVQPDRVAQLNRGESYIEDVPSEVLKAHVDAGLVTATTDYDELEAADAILVALPTPLSAQREPDLTILLDAAREIATRLKQGQLVVLESTTYPGTTRERVAPLLEALQETRALHGDAEVAHERAQLFRGDLFARPLRHSQAALARLLRPLPLPSAL